MAAVQLASFPAAHQHADSSALTVRELDALAGAFRDVLPRRMPVDMVRELLCQPVPRAAWLSLAVAATRWAPTSSGPASAADWCAAVEEVYLTAASALALVLTVFNLSVPLLKTASALVRAQTLQALAKQLAEVNEGLRKPAAAAAAAAAQTAGGTSARSSTGAASSAVTGAGAGGGGGSRVEGAEVPVAAAALGERGAFVLSLALAITHGLLACDIDEGQLDIEGGSTAAQQAALTAAFPAYHANLAAALSSSRILEHAAQTHALLHLLGAPAAGRTGDLWAHVIGVCADVAMLRQRSYQLPPRTVYTSPVLRQLLLVRGLQVLCDLDGGPGYGLTPALLRRVPARGSRAEMLTAAIATATVVPGSLCPPELPLHQLATVLAEHLPSSVGPRATATLLLRAGFAALAQSRRRLSALLPAADQDTAAEHARLLRVQLTVVVRALEGTLSALPKALLTASPQPQMQQLINNMAAAPAGSVAIGPSGFAFGTGAVGAEPRQQQTGGGGGSGGTASGSGAPSVSGARCWPGIMEGRWRLAIGAAELYVAAGADMGAGMLRDLGRSLMPPTSIWGPAVSPTGSSSADNVTIVVTWPLPPPSPFMAAALAAGLPRGLERLLRAASRPAAIAAAPQSGWVRSEILGALLHDALLLDARCPFGLLELLLYSPPRQAAALVVTVGKLLRLPVALLEQATAQQQEEQPHQPPPQGRGRLALHFDKALREVASEMLGLMVQVCGTAAMAVVEPGAGTAANTQAGMRLLPQAVPVWLPPLSRAVRDFSLLMHTADDSSSESSAAAIAQLLTSGVLSCVWVLARRALNLSSTAASLHSQHAKRAGDVASPPAAAAAAAAPPEPQQQARSDPSHTASGAAAAVAGAATSSSAACEATGGGAEEEREAAALKRLLLQEVDVVSLLGAGLLLLHRCRQWDADYLQKLTGACCAVAALCPEEVRAAVRRPPPPNTQPVAQEQGSGNAGAFQSLEDRVRLLVEEGRVAECGCFYWCTDSAQLLLKKLEAASSGRSATPEDLAVLHAAETLGASLTEWSKRRGAASSAGDERISHTLAVAADLVQARVRGGFPRVQDLCSLAEARALLPPSAACGNPLCINVEGDSEAELPPPAVACHGRGDVGRGGGGAGRGGSAGSAASSSTGGGGGSCGLRYCSRECAAAHWKGGHREACAAAGVRAAS
ncbi:hypothetical protein HXX76_012860 [Chlamydomonas incerta]|uniref:MYND-type domain-containing protein n=1 Tax=Chlamydomonas incerta TaxID=51695 RepID=A0A835VRR6_CHLIN|nr:hypothetical protein HXX76_012860 [Chlamydomonas incerta]|eukprot:KAG2426807.1 hypothetical protein HXX76_012860 [Chlamydomonas incerta]